MNTGRCFKLNRVGAEIWAMLAAETSLGEICTRVAERYRLGPERIEEEVRVLIEQLRSENLVEPGVVPGP